MLYQIQVTRGDIQSNRDPAEQPKWPHPKDWPTHEADSPRQAAIDHTRKHFHTLIEHCGEVFTVHVAEDAPGNMHFTLVPKKVHAFVMRVDLIVREMLDAALTALEGK